MTKQNTDIERQVGILRDFIYQIVRGPDSPVTEAAIENIARKAIEADYDTNVEQFDEAQKRFRATPS